MVQRQTVADVNGRSLRTGSDRAKNQIRAISLALSFLQGLGLGCSGRATAQKVRGHQEKNECFHEHGPLHAQPSVDTKVMGGKPKKSFLYQNPTEK